MIQPPSSRFNRRQRIASRIIAVLGVLALVLTNAPALHLLGFDPIETFPARHRQAPLAAVFLSGDMGFHFGMSRSVATALAARGVPVVGIVSPVMFAQHRTRAEALSLVEAALRLGMTSTGARHVVLVGQSFGADIIATVLPNLPSALLAHIDAIDLMVPGRDVYFRADPSGIAYWGRPDASPAHALAAFRGPPIICIYGIKEEDSLCPSLDRSAVHVIPLPGNHHLDHDPARLVAAALGALHSIIPQIRA